MQALREAEEAEAQREKEDEAQDGARAHLAEQAAAEQEKAAAQAQAEAARQKRLEEEAVAKAAKTANERLGARRRVSLHGSTQRSQNSETLQMPRTGAVGSRATMGTGHGIDLSGLAGLQGSKAGKADKEAEKQQRWRRAEVPRRYARPVERAIAVYEDPRTNLYNVLDLRMKASDEAIRKRYRELAIALHPGNIAVFSQILP